LAVTFGLSMYPDDINSVFAFANILGYAFFAVIMIPFLIWFVSWMKKIAGRKQTS
ncbi:MAG: spore gernimation protein, partial [Bacillus amyloliquefaciens]